MERQSPFFARRPGPCDPWLATHSPEETVAADGQIDPREQAILDDQEAIVQATEAAHGLLYRGAIPRRIRRSRPDLLALAALPVVSRR